MAQQAETGPSWFAFKMPAKRKNKIRFALNLANLVTGVVLIAGFIWTALDPEFIKECSAVFVIYEPALQAFAKYALLNAGDRVLVVAACYVVNAMLLLVFLFSFKLNIEEWVAVVIGLPFYLLLAVSVFLSVDFAIVLFRSMF